MLITPELVFRWRPCPGYAEARVRELLGVGLTPLQVCDMDIPVNDRLWVLLREEVIPARTLRLLVCRWAEEVLPIYEAAHPDDPRPRNAIAAARSFARGEINIDELRGAVNGARAAEAAAARNARATWAAESAAIAARVAAESAAGAIAARVAAERAAVAAAARVAATWAAESAAIATTKFVIQERQLGDVRSVLIGELSLEACSDGCARIGEVIRC